MTNNQILREEQSRDLGRFRVGRLLPFKEKRSVGPFCFVDHMGPTRFEDGSPGLGVDQHPHIGLCTLTYLYEGAVEHRDSTGAHQLIEPGAVNLMRSGKGVTHTERSPEPAFGNRTLHGYQLWIALPVEMEESEPAFFHIPSNEIPTWMEGDLHIRLLAGSAWGKTSPLPTWSPLFLADIRTEFRGELDLKGMLKGEIALIVVKGEAWVDDQAVLPGQMLISKTEDACQLHLGDDSSVLVFGGSPLPEERFMYWNFVSHSKERLEKAKDDWRNKRFPQVPNDETYIPLPGESS